MNNKEKRSLLFGALAGAAVGYWLNSDKGREVRDNALEASKQKLDTVSEYVAEEASTIKSHAGRLIQKSIDIAREAIENVPEETNDVSSKMSDSFTQGIDKAKKAIDEIERQLEVEKSNA